MTSEPVVAAAPTRRDSVARHVVLLLELAVAAWIVLQLRIEGAALAPLMLVALVGFALVPWLPRGAREPFFVVVSLAAAVVTFGFADAAWLAAGVLALVGACHLPLPVWGRVVVLLMLGAGLAVARAGLVPAPFASVVWPVLGSILMFRLAIYLRALSSGKAGTFGASTLSYFFQFPNLAFPLYPVMDYNVYRRSHFDRDEWEIYDTGMTWIARGLLHLVLYRVAYLFVVTDPVSVADLGDLLRNMGGTFLLYLRVSGQFHLIVGLLHLFGYRLPETHHLYYLSRSFTDLWRRINIYWKDFMLQQVFYPTYFGMKGRGPRWALVWSTAMVFAVTWILHSYQWFWLRGGFPISANDILFWGILGTLVVFGALREAAQPTRSRRGAGFDARAGLDVMRTFAIFCVLWSLWSTESVGAWLWMVSSGATLDIGGIVLLGSMLAALFLIGGWNWDSGPPAVANWLGGGAGTRRRRLATLGALFVISVPAADAAMPGSVANAIGGLRDNRLNARDAALQHRGYYEQLEIRERIGAPGDLAATRPADWRDVGSLGVIRETMTPETRELIPSMSVDWNGRTFSTNTFGMRDGEYPIAKPEGALRIALLGPSHVMGNGVGDGEAFESIVEARLNAAPSLGGRPVEILNFAVDGFSMPQQVESLLARVLAFAPDVVIATHYQQNGTMTQRYLVKIRERDIAPSDEALRQAVADAGLMEPMAGGLPLPFAPLRAAARQAGIGARMPSAEIEGRAHRAAASVLRLSLLRFAEVTRAAGAEPILLVLDDVLDGVDRRLIDKAGIEQAGMPVIDLLDIYSTSDRARLRVAPWDNHPNTEGHRLIAERLYPELLAILETLPRTAETSSSPAR